MELAYNGLHQLCAPMLDHLERLPQPQRTALATVFGLSDGPAPDRFLVGLATLTLFADVAEHQPLVCIVDDAQWLDQVSAQILAFVARRLLAERVAIVCAARTGIGDEVLAGLPELSLGGLGDSDALALLLENLHGPLDAAVSQRIVAESHGNPLALVELPRTWSVAELAGGFGLPEGLPVTGRIEASYLRRLHRLPSDTQLLVLAAAAEPVGDPVAAPPGRREPRDRHGRGRGRGGRRTADDPRARGVRTPTRSLLRLPLGGGPRPPPGASRPRRCHRCRDRPRPTGLAPCLRRSWARRRGRRRAGTVSRPCPGPRRHRRRGRVPAASGRADTRTRRDVPRRAVAAAEASFQAGAFDSALQLVATAETSPLDGFQRARAALLRGHVAVVSSYGNDAAPLLLRAARELEALDLDLARKAYLTAWGAAITAGHLGGADILVDVCRAVRALPPLTADAHPLHLVLDGLALLTTAGRAAATPVLQRAANAVDRLSVEDVLRWGWLAPAASKAIWDWDGFVALDERQVQIIRDAGALAELPLHLHSSVQDKAWRGDFAGADALIAEAEGVAAATGTRIPPFGQLWLWSRQGREADTSALVDATIKAATTGGQGIGAMSAHWSAAVLYNGLARYDEALSAANQVSANAIDPFHSMFVLPELVEAAARIGNPGLARDALERLAETTQPAGPTSGGDSKHAVEQWSSAALPPTSSTKRQSSCSVGPRSVPSSLAHISSTASGCVAKAGALTPASSCEAPIEMFVTIGMEAFAERARRELMATGERVRKRRPETRHDLTPQEEQIARLARDGFANPEIGAQLFISAKTVEWHLGKVFAKLGINSRRELRTALPGQSHHLVSGT